MPSPSGADHLSLKEKALRAHDLLLDHYGDPAWKVQRDPLSELLVTILSQNTNDINSGRAYESLRQRFPTWEDVLAADVDHLADSIRVGGLANIKAPRMQRILQQLMEERGSLNLAFLGDMSVPEARDYLLSLHGVGPKTAACVLLFSLHMPALPVDTHVFRISKKLGLVPPKASAEKAHTILEELLPEETYYPFHLNVIHHGRTLCKARDPQCEACPLTGECEWLKSMTDATDALEDGD